MMEIWGGAIQIAAPPRDQNEKREISDY